MADYVVYGSPLSPFVRKVEVVLKTLELAYDFENVNIMDKPDWFLEISPAGRIPVLRDRIVGEEGIPGTIADSSAICLFLERKHDAGLYGASAFDAGVVAFLEEYADTEVAAVLGMQLFRPLIFPRFQGKESDLDTARKGWNEGLPPRFDVLEKRLAGRDFFVGDKLSVADIAVGAQMTQLDLVAGLPDASRWPSLVRHTQAMKAQPGFTENLAVCGKMLAQILPEKVDLS